MQCYKYQPKQSLNWVYLKRAGQENIAFSNFSKQCLSGCKIERSVLQHSLTDVGLV